MLNKARLSDKCAAQGIVLHEEMTRKFLEYAEFLCAYNEHTNLTAITEPDEVETKHILDSLIFAAQAEVQGSLLDVGSGAGFPGIPAKIYNPALHVVLLESNGKKARFLEAAAVRLQIDVEILNMRAEEAAQKVEYRGRFQTVAARAVAQMNALCEYCLPFVATGGHFIAMKSGGAGDEVAAALPAIAQLGGMLKEQRSYTLPDEARRTLVLVQKMTETPKKFPRNPAAIKKRPL